MSRILPSAVVDTIRGFTDVSLDLYGIECTLYKIINDEARQALDVYAQRPKANFLIEKTKVFIDWTPDIRKLKHWGIYVEGQVPIVAWLPWTKELRRGSYFTIDLEFIRDRYDTEAFELLEPIMQGLHDQEIVTRWKIAPLRK